MIIERCNISYHSWPCNICEDKPFDFKEYDGFMRDFYEYIKESNKSTLQDQNLEKIKTEFLEKVWGDLLSCIINR